VLAADTHPLQNLGVLARLRAMGRPEEEVQAWAASANAAGLAACEALLADARGPFAFVYAPPESPAGNAFLLASLVEGQVGGSHAIELIAAFVTGDVTGMLATVALAHYIFLSKR
jgi:hypothetical protein